MQELPEKVFLKRLKVKPAPSLPPVPSTSWLILGFHFSFHLKELLCVAGLINKGVGGEQRLQCVLSSEQ